MTTRRIDGKLFEQMVLNGLNNIILKEKAANEMNVFPVPDGDTGTNMRLTLSNGVKRSGTTDNLSDYVSELTNGMLLGARGNSGVILSQIFKGISSELKGLESMNTSDFMRALICGYKTAYSAVVNPVEGTVLTVAREGTEYLSKLFQPDTTFETILELYLQGMRSSLKRTPQILPLLMQAGVEDSGAFGFIIIIDGMYRFLCGEKIEAELPHDMNEEPVDLEAFTSDSKFEYGYCMEFLLRLMNSKTDIESFNSESFSEKLKTMGESVVCVKEGSVVKVHIHVFKPSPVIDFAQKFGEFLTFKLENMCLQHNENTGIVRRNKEHFPLAVVAVGNGCGIADSLSAFNYVVYLDGGSTMNTSTEEFADAVKSIDADRIVIMPNNKNIVKSARLAVELCGKDNVEIIESSDVVQCFYALSMDVPSNPVDERISAFKQACNELKSLCMFKSVRTCTIGGVECKEGEFVCSSDSSLIASGSGFIETLENAVKSVEGYQDFEMCFAYTGSGFVYEDEVQSLFDREFPGMTLQLIPGGQEYRDLIMGLV